MKQLRMGLIGLLILVNMLYGLTWVENSAGGLGPVISCGDAVLEISLRDGDGALLSGVTAWDPQDGDLSDSVYVQGVSKLKSDETARVTYLVFDSHGNMASAERTVRYRDYRRPRFAVKAPLIYNKEGDVSWLSGIRALDALDGDITDAIHVSTLSPTEDPDIHLVSLWATNSRGDTGYVTLPVMQDAGQDTVTLKRYLVYLDAGGTFDSRAYLEEPAGVTATGTVDTNTPGTYWVTYRDRAGQARAVLTVVVV